MLVLGYAGGVDLPYQHREHLLTYPFFHDSASALVEDGRLIAAIEEERLNRIKHTNKGPISAIRFCLEQRGARLSDVDQLVLPADESVVAAYLRQQYMEHPEQARVEHPAAMIQDLLRQGLDDDIGDDRISFVRHHVAHAVSSYALSGFDESLIVAIDGWGDGYAGTIMSASGGKMEVLRDTAPANSLGNFYLRVTQFLGFAFFDEYKVMGLAPYGDAAKYRHLFKGLYELLPQGEYQLRMNLLHSLLDIACPRNRSEPITQVHQDIAAALQESLEEILFHVLNHFREETGHRHLCLAGGVALNCTFNGKLLESKLFDRVFVQPASHDGGLALGAALYPFLEHRTGNGHKMEHTFLGPAVGANDAILETLKPWSDFLDFELCDDVATVTAGLLAEGSVGGWVQGRSEFGPRALGNRSIVADPRPARNKDIINSMVKKREAFRPFAPAVLEEHAAEYFKLAAPPEDYRFMTMIARVREEKAPLLGATTHVDGTARIQTVSKETNPQFWDLIKEFGELTGVPVLLNTSLNNNVEPIVDSATDAIVLFLTTQIDVLVIGDYLIRKKPVSDEAYLRLILSLPLHKSLNHSRHFASKEKLVDVFYMGNTIHKRFDLEISREAFDLLQQADGEVSLGELLEGIDTDRRKMVVNEMIELWSKRAIKLLPACQSNGTLA